ncbi:MAG: HAD-IA family hydrolase [Nitrospirota bacterium]|nr:HAD-IA family hydrolase [Nitrospirota bacterium]
MHPTVHDIKEALKSNAITHVLLDMDGTLLDKYFDDYFWEHLVPEKYADKHKITFGKAKEELLRKYKSHEETLNWTDIDFWSRELGLEIMALKEQIRHLIEIHPHVEEFLGLMRSRRKKVYIATNAHDRVLAMKMKKTELGKYLTGTITSAEMGYPKEHQEFWHRLEKKLGFSRDSALFVDDTLAVLRSARKYGIKYLVYKAKGNSKVPPGKSDEFATVMDFNELM